MKKILLLTMMSILALTIASSCSDDNDEKKDNFSVQLERQVANVYWKVYETQIVDKDGNTYTIEEAASKDMLMVGELFMDGLFLEDNTVSYYSTPFTTFYVDMPVLSIEGNAMKFSDYDVCTEIVFESVAPDALTVSYWHDSVLLDIEATKNNGTPVFQKGSYFKSLLRKASDEEILRFKNAERIR